MQDAGVVMARVLLAFALAVAGGAASSAVAVSHRSLCRLISLAAGALLGVTVFVIIPECREGLTTVQVAAALISGYGVFFLVSRYVFHVCPACAASHFDEAATRHFSEIAVAMIVALGLHSTLDGLALALGREESMGRSMDATLLLAICVHKVPEGLALGALLLASGMKRLRAVAVVAAVESTTLLGGILGLWILPRVSGLWIDLALAHVGGGFIFLALHAVFGELVNHGKRIVLAGFSLGVVLILFLHLALHSH